MSETDRKWKFVVRWRDALPYMRYDLDSREIKRTSFMEIGREESLDRWVWYVWIGRLVIALWRYQPGYTPVWFKGGLRLAKQDSKPRKTK